MTTANPTDSTDEADIARQRDEVVKRMLATPPQPRNVSKKRRSDAS